MPSLIFVPTHQAKKALMLASSCFRDDTFSDTLSQKADSEASSGPVTEDKSSSKDMNSPTDRHSDSYLAR